MEAISPILFLVSVYLLSVIGLAGIFRKAGEAWWKALVPLYNAVIWLKITGRPLWWLALLIMPVVGFVVSVGMNLDMVRSFGKNKFYQHAAGVIAPWLYFILLGFRKKDAYKGKWATDLAPEYAKTRKRSEVREWADAILFAGMSALLIRTFMIEAFMIPTTSMEGSLKAGDFLFVSKFHYGVRMPMVPLSFPFVHNTMPFTTATRSFIEWPILPYFRTPGLRDVERNDIVVFNYPDDDEHPDVPELGAIHPTSMKQNYIKRCVAVGGDTLKIVKGELFINGKPAWKADGLQRRYHLVDAQGICNTKFLDEYGFRFNQLRLQREKNIDRPDQNDNFIPIKGHPGLFEVQMNQTTLEKLNSLGTLRITEVLDTMTADVSAHFATLDQGRIDGMARDPLAGKQMIFPKNPKLYPWTIDDFGPLWVPKKGVKIPLTAENIYFYRKIIDVYEDHDFEQRGGKFFIDGKEETSYTFEMNYYFMMGDNRCASLDSRFWGFVPEDHVVGRPILVLFSWDRGPVWSRFFHGIGSLEP